MEQIYPLLPGALTAGLGAALCAVGYRLIHHNSIGMGVLLFSALGVLAGARMNSLPLAIALLVAGATLAYALHKYLARVYVALAAACAGSVVGLVVALLTFSSHPQLLACATAAGFALLALVEGRVTTIMWTAAAGACFATLGLLGLETTVALLYAAAPPEFPAFRDHALRALKLASALFAAGIVFQMVTSPPLPSAPEAPASETPSRRKRPSKLMARAMADADET